MKRDGKQPIEYKSSLDGWYEKSAVRSKPRRMLAEEERGKTYFPPNLVPIANHPLVSERGPEVARELIIRHLYGYLDFTTHLEHGLVNRAVQQIFSGGTDFELTHAMRLDGYKLYCDEAYHALFSEDLKRQVFEQTGVALPPAAEPSFLKWFRELQASHAPEVRGLLEVFFAVVAETLITATLVQVPRDPSVITAVREVITDHALDEAIHHRYFSQIFHTAWPQLTKRQRRIVGPLLPQFALQFLQPDLESCRRNLRVIGLDRDAAEQVAVESFPRHELVRSMRKTAQSMLRLFEDHGLQDDSAVADSFEACGLDLTSPQPKTWSKAENRR